MGHWEHFSHQADIGVRGMGESIATAFEQAALALTAVITDLARVTPTQSMTVECDNPDRELLLVDWLNAIVYAMATRKLLFSAYDVHLEGAHLTATLHGEPVNVNKHQPAVEVKGATYTELKVAQQADGLWLAQCVVDV
ncbi:MAG TPA: archease [Gammaproteobacteria bacterium]